MSSILVNTIGFAAIIIVILWFWVLQPRRIKLTSNTVDILVADGVYTPATIQVSADKPITLNFLRKDSSPCSAVVIFDDLNKSAELPIEQKLTLKLGKIVPGQYPFHCQMNMYKGNLIVINHVR